MKNITNELRDQAYAAATDEQSRLYTAEETFVAVNTMITKHGITGSEQGSLFSTIVGDVILGLRNQSELPQILTEELSIPTEKAVAITGDVIDLISKGAAPTPTPNQTLKDASHIRTMQQDMSQHNIPDEIIYTSTQDAILQEGRLGNQSNPQTLPTNPAIQP
ncbi:MAG: hypothetical protein KC877_01155 [Candidatus Kaiserbacteria bacterium]|nr:hypothetical protein [Candidatus Kaiserbacteria bacterium]MCB9816511.1 hypothetical protein [Candidatus Nomurabacteria bacterium]